MKTYKLTPTKKTIAELLKDGKYDYINSDISSKNFKGGTPAKEIGLMEINGYKTTSEIEKLIAEKGYEPATLADMLHFGIQYPDEQRNHFIIFLGAAWVNPDGYRRVGCLSGGAGRRDCGLLWDGPGGQWLPRCVFAVRRRKSELGSSDTLSSEPLGALPRVLVINGVEYERKDDLEED